MKVLNKRYYIALSISILFICTVSSCNNVSKSDNETKIIKNSIENNDLSNNSKQDKEYQKPLPEGYFWGKVEPYVGKNKTEQNIMSQISTYMNALSRGDIDGAANFLYPDAITYFRKYYPDYFTDRDIIREFYKDLSDSFVKGNQEYKNRGMEYEFIVAKIDKIIETDSGILCVFGLTIQIGKGDKYFYIVPTKDDYTVGISFNMGQNWYFIARNEDTPNILRLRFSNQVITQIMDY